MVWSFLNGHIIVFGVKVLARLAPFNYVVPNRFALHQNVPTPFNSTTVIQYDAPDGGGAITLRVYDVAGRLVRTLVDAVETPGEKRVVWYGRDNRGNRTAAGVYFYRMTAHGFETAIKMVLLQ